MLWWLATWVDSSSAGAGVQGAGKRPSWWDRGIILVCASENVTCFLDMIHRSTPVDLKLWFRHSSLYIHTSMHLHIYIYIYICVWYIPVYIYIQGYISCSIFPTSAMARLLQDVEHVVSPAPALRLGARLAAAQQLEAARLGDVAGAAGGPGEGHVLREGVKKTRGGRSLDDIYIYIYMYIYICIYIYYCIIGRLGKIRFDLDRIDPVDRRTDR